jgi:DNA-binding NarL/FixJ family response regulator
MPPPWYKGIMPRLHKGTGVSYLKEIALIVVVAAIVAGTLQDFVVDLSGGASLRHLLQEVVIVTVSVLAIGYLVNDLRRQRAELVQLKQDLDRSKQHRAASPQLLQAREQMGRVIQEQFQQWALTASEQEVALLLLKGLSFREIAEVRDTLEKTVRQQASSIYKKANVAGRASFAAWFIEDIL